VKNSVMNGDAQGYERVTSCIARKLKVIRMGKGTRMDRLMQWTKSAF
jgi:hypothetical protein